MSTELEEDDLGKVRRVATTSEARENQLIALAFDVVEERMREGTATAAETVHFLKLGSTREVAERENIYLKNELLKVQKENIESAARIEELYTEAISALKTYNGSNVVSEDDDEYYE